MNPATYIKLSDLLCDAAFELAADGCYKPDADIIHQMLKLFDALSVPQFSDSGDEV